jgi:hypothetical protein
VINECEESPKKFTGPKKGRFSETDDVVFMYIQERDANWNKLYCIVLTANTFSQNPVFDIESKSSHDSNPRLIFLPSKTVKGRDLDLRIYSGCVNIPSSQTFKS